MYFHELLRGWELNDHEPKIKDDLDNLGRSILDIYNPQIRNGWYEKTFEYI